MPPFPINPVYASKLKALPLILLLGAFGFVPSSEAIVFSWPSAPGWTAGAPTAGNTASQSFTAASPNDITVAVGNNPGNAMGATWGAGYPVIDSTSETGGLSGVNGLQLYVTKQDSTSSVIRTTITFANPVAGLTFQLWDIDASAGQFVDQISSIQALAVGGGTVGPTSVTSAVPGFNTISGSGLSTVIAGTALASDTSNQGTIDITFSGQITQFSFDWSNNDTHLKGQAIGIGPLTFAVVPEANTAWFIIPVCLLATGQAELLRRRRRREELSKALHFVS